MSATTFTPTQHSSAEDKAKFLRQLQGFITSGFPTTKFSKPFYNRLSNCFGHIAHYNQGGFYAEWFSTTADQVRFLERILEYPAYGQPDFTFCDVEKAAKAWLLSTDHLEKLRAKRDAAIEAAERAQLARLSEKYPNP